MELVLVLGYEAVFSRTVGIPPFLPLYLQGIPSSRPPRSLVLSTPPILLSRRSHP